MSQNLLEKLQLAEEKNLLIQGLPSSIEKQFAKLAFAKSLTPLLKSKKIDFALIFAVNERQLSAIVDEVLPALRENAKFWVAYPKSTSKIATTLNRECSWACITGAGYESSREETLDHVWTALRFKKAEAIAKINQRQRPKEHVLVEAGEEEEVMTVDAPADFVRQLRLSKTASHFFDKLSTTDKHEYVSWITSAKKEETRSRRMEMAIGKLIAGKRTPAAK